MPATVHVSVGVVVVTVSVPIVRFPEKAAPSIDKEPLAANCADAAVSWSWITYGDGVQPLSLILVVPVAITALGVPVYMTGYVPPPPP